MRLHHALHPGLLLAATLLALPAAMPLASSMALPDLVAQDFRLLRADAGGFQVIFDDVNFGDNNAGTYRTDLYVDGVYFSSIGGSDPTASQPPYHAGGGRSPVTWYPATGEHVLSGAADTQDQVAEKDETNNAFTLHVQLADLADAPPTISGVNWDFPPGTRVQGWLSISGYPEDADGGQDIRVTFSVDGVTQDERDGTRGFAFSWDSCAAGEGQHTLTLRITDGIDASWTDADADVVCGAAPPPATTTSPAEAPDEPAVASPPSEETRSPPREAAPPPTEPAPDAPAEPAPTAHDPQPAAPEPEPAHPAAHGRLPDIIAVRVRADAHLAKLEPTTWLATLRNAGGDAGAFRVRWLVNGELWDEQEVAGVSAGASVSLASRAWDPAPGTTRVRVLADADGALAERSHANNAASTSVSIAHAAREQLPRVVPAAATVPPLRLATPALAHDAPVALTRAPATWRASESAADAEGALLDLRAAAEVTSPQAPASAYAVITVGDAAPIRVPASVTVLGDGSYRIEAHAARDAAGLDGAATARFLIVLDEGLTSEARLAAPDAAIGLPDALPAARPAARPAAEPAASLPSTPTAPPPPDAGQAVLAAPVPALPAHPEVEPVLVISAGLANIGTVEQGTERTLPLQLTAYRGAAHGVVVRCLTPGVSVEALSPPLDIGAGQTIVYYVKVRAADLPANGSAQDQRLLFQATADRGNASNVESVDLIVHTAEFRGLPGFGGAATLVAVAAGGAAAFFRRRP
jgi:hypothetical protein